MQLVAHDGLLTAGHRNTLTRDQVRVANPRTCRVRSIPTHYSAQARKFAQTQRLSGVPVDETNRYLQAGCLQLDLGSRGMRFAMPGGC